MPLASWRWTSRWRTNVVVSFLLYSSLQHTCVGYEYVNTPYVDGAKDDRSAAKQQNRSEDMVAWTANLTLSKHDNVTWEDLGSPAEKVWLVPAGDDPNAAPVVVEQARSVPKAGFGDEEPVNRCVYGKGEDCPVMFHKAVRQLADAELAAAVEDRERCTLVLAYAEWCGLVKKFLQRVDYSQVAHAFRANGTLSVAVFNTSDRAKPKQWEGGFRPGGTPRKSAKGAVVESMWRAAGRSTFAQHFAGGAYWMSLTLFAYGHAVPYHGPLGGRQGHSRRPSRTRDIIKFVDRMCKLGWQTRHDATSPFEHIWSPQPDVLPATATEWAAAALLGGIEYEADPELRLHAHSRPDPGLPEDDEDEDDEEAREPTDLQHPFQEPLSAPCVLCVCGYTNACPRCDMRPIVRFGMVVETERRVGKIIADKERKRASMPTWGDDEEAGSGTELALV